MVDKVKCGNKECEEFGKPVPVSLYFINKIAPLDGPWPCVACGETMRIALVTPNSFKSGATKIMPRRITTSQLTSNKHLIGKKKKYKGIKVSGPTLGGHVKKTSKTTTKRSLARKRY